MPVAESNVYNRRPGLSLIWESWATAKARQGLAGKPQRNSTKVDQLGGTFITIGSDSPLSSALATTSSYDSPYATTRSSSAEKATHPPGGAAWRALTRSSGRIGNLKGLCASRYHPTI